MLVLVVGSLFLLMGVCWATYRTALLLKDSELDFNLLLLPAENLLRLLVVGLCLVIGLVSGVGSERLGWRLEDPPLEIALGLGAGLFIWWILDPITLGAIGRFGRGIYSPQVLKSILPTNRRQWVLVPLALLPAILMEELLFRSLLVGGFSALVNPLAPASLFSLAFGFMHAPQGRLAVVITAVVGFLLSLLFLWRGSLLAPFLAHYLLNLLQLVRAAMRREWLESFDAIS